MELTPENTAGIRSLLDGMAEKIAELEADVARIRAEHDEIRAEHAAIREKLDALADGDTARKEPGGEAADGEGRDGA